MPTAKLFSGRRPRWASGMLSSLPSQPLLTGEALMEISLTRKQAKELSAKYDYGQSEKVLESLLPNAKLRGYLLPKEIYEVAKWKWRGGRTRQLVSENKASYLKEVTALSFSTECEQIRVEVLRILRGVQWPMASVILHFSFVDRYPILDVRAMRAVGGNTSYNFENWIHYTEVCRKASKRLNISMRELDRGLWVQGGS